MSLRQFTIWILIMFVAQNCGNAEENQHKNSTSSNRIISSICKVDPKLKMLDCSDSSLTNLFTEKEWVDFNNTRAKTDTITFSNNAIDNVPVFPDLIVVRLILKRNAIKSIASQAFRNLTELEELDLSYNHLTFAALRPEVFKGKYNPDNYEPLNSLKVLNLGNNELHSIDQDIFEHMPNLESLILESNPFLVIDHMSSIAISQIPYLKFLDLSYMELKTLPEHMLHAPKHLEVLNLTGNLLTRIPEALEYAVNLKYLNLDENPMESIIATNAFPFLPNLEVLSISYMAPLRLIGRGGLGQLTSLQSLICTNNPHLSYIHPFALSRNGTEETIRQEWPPIKHLYVSSNNISTLDSQLIARWDNVESIDIRANPWSCDCDNQWMLDKLIPAIIKHEKYANQIICNEPSEMKNKNLTELVGHKMRCSDYYGNRPEKDGAVLIGILVGLLIGIPITFALFLVYKRGCFGLWMPSSGPADYSRAFYKRAHLGDDFHI